ncbi:MAG TPA: adenylate/guanylate cyclase domain-containing protein [Chitinophagaceae bacterium]|nr:adenylate/guanylate cyclase domain-containing protein [Chitinophagaceae bacterium]
MSQSRQLAAIMFTDIVGYTALMGSDEQKAFQLLKKNRQIQQPLIKQYNGTWIKEIGDAVLASFHTVTDAVLCAGAIHNACSTVDGLQLRIGIHLGEVVFEDHDVFGDGVNIASRLQALAPIGGTFVSEAIYKNVSNKKEIITEFVREENLKNVSEPVKIYEIKLLGTANFQPETLQDLKKGSTIITAKKKKIIAGIAAFTVLGILLLYFLFINPKKESTPSSDVTTEKSIAVLPFVNMSGDKEQEYFSDGLSEELLNLLSKIPDLKVISRTSAFSFKGKNEDVRKIGEKLGVANILEGSVRKSGNTIRITAQLIEVHYGTHLWSETYDRNVDDIFKVQDEISKAVVEQLKIKLLNANKTIVTENSEAYSLYLKGKYEWAKRTREGFLKSIDFYNEAIKEDPKYSLAYAGMADSYTLLCGYHILSPEASISKAKVAAEKAMQLNPTLAEAFEATGHIEFLVEVNWQKAEDNYKKAIRLNPSFATARQRYALMMATQERYNEALEEIKKAQELDPLSKIINTDAGLIELLKGNADNAINQCKNVLDIDSAFSVALFIQGLAFEQMGKTEAAVSNFQRAVNASNNNPISVSALGYALAKSGKKAEALKILKDLEASSGQKYVSPYCKAVIHAGLGNRDVVFQLLNQAVDDKSVWMIHLHLSADPRFEELKSDKRYSELLKRIQFLKE